MNQHPLRTAPLLVLLVATLAQAEPGADELKLVDRKVEFAPTLADGKTITKCNLFLAAAAREAFGYAGFDGKTANQIHDILAENADWAVILKPSYKDEDLKAAFERCAREADQGKLVVVAWKNTAGEHCHVALVDPGALVASGKWGMKAPRIAQAGPVRSNGGVSRAGAPARPQAVFKDESLTEGFGTTRRATCSSPSTSADRPREP